MRTPRKDCYGCRAIDAYDYGDKCALGKPTRFILHDHAPTDGHHIPLEHCPKPMTYKKLEALRDIGVGK